MRLVGKTALVIGGTRGIGRGVVEGFASEGATVVLAGRDAVAGAAVVDAVRASGHEAQFVACDVTDLAALRRLFAVVVDRHERLDTLVNCAGSNIGHSLFEATEEEYVQLFDLNVRSVFFGTKWGAEAMIPTGGGAIINITSSAATRGYKERTLYCATKGAVLMMSKAAALDVAAHHIRINCISPGAVDTPLFRRLHFDGADDQDRLVADYGSEQPLGRVGSVAEIGAAAVYLASDDAAWIGIRPRGSRGSSVRLRRWTMSRSAWLQGSSLDFWGQTVRENLPRSRC